MRLSDTQAAAIRRASVILTTEGYNAFLRHVADCKARQAVRMELQRAARERAGRIRNANGKGN